MYLYLIINSIHSHLHIFTNSMSAQASQIITDGEIVRESPNKGSANQRELEPYVFEKEYTAATQGEVLLEEEEEEEASTDN